MSILIDIEEARSAYKVDPGLFFAQLDRQLQLHTVVHATQAVAAADKQWGVQLQQWAEEMKIRLAELGYSAPSAATYHNLYGLKKPLAEFKKEFGLAVEKKGELEIENLLDRMLAFDAEEDDLVPPKPLLPGAVGIWVRILQYRLKKLCCYHSEVNGVYGERTLEAVVIFKHAFGLPLSQELPGLVDRTLWSITADPFELNRLMLAKLRGRPIVVQDTFLSDWVPEAAPGDTFFVCNHRFSVSRTLDCQPVSTLVKQTDWVLNRQAVALLQFWFWMTSFYLDPIDGQFGGTTLHALLCFIEENHLDTDSYIVRLSDGRLALSPGIFDALGAQLPDASEMEAYERYLYAESDKLLKEEEKKASQYKKTKEDKNFLELVWDGIKNVASKLYRGVKTALVSTTKAIARGARWCWNIVGKVGSALHFLSCALARIKKALGVFWSNLKRFLQFLYSRSVVTANGETTYTTHFFRDFDVVNFRVAPHNVNIKTDHHRHTEKVWTDVRLFSLSCDVVGAAIGAVISFLEGPIGWIRLGFKVSNVIREVLEVHGKGSLSVLLES